MRTHDTTRHRAIMLDVWGDEWNEVSDWAERVRLMADVQSILNEAMALQDGSIECFRDAAIELRRRVRTGNLRAYVDTLMAVKTTVGWWSLIRNSQILDGNTGNSRYPAGEFYVFAGGTYTGPKGARVWRTLWVEPREWLGEMLESQLFGDDRGKKWNLGSLQPVLQKYGDNAGDWSLIACDAVGIVHARVCDKLTHIPPSCQEILDQRGEFPHRHKDQGGES